MARNDVLLRINRKAAAIAAFFLFTLAAGTIGYRLIGGRAYGLIDCLYMTVITVTTIGFGEIIDLSNHPGGRLFTMGLAFFGAGLFTYVLSSITLAATDGDLRKQWRKRKMIKAIEELSGHYILCGWGSVSLPVYRELQSTGRPCVIVAERAGDVRQALGDETPPYLLEGDVTEDDLLRAAGIGRAVGLFAVAGEDPINIVICLTARQLAPKVRLVACVIDPRNSAKMTKAGADAVVSALQIGALRMASVMVRPTVVSFLDTMLRSQEQPLRIEEVTLGPGKEDRTVDALHLDRFEHSLLVALRQSGEWVFHPKGHHPVREGDVLIFMTTPDEREKLTREFA